MVTTKVPTARVRWEAYLLEINGRIMDSAELRTPGNASRIVHALNSLDPSPTREELTIVKSFSESNLPPSIQSLLHLQLRGLGLKT